MNDRSHRFTTFAGYLDAVAKAHPYVNRLALVGHSTLRMAVMDRVDRPATEDEIEAMATLFDESLRAGAIGLSSGLAYAMAKSAATEEVIALCRRTPSLFPLIRGMRPVPMRWPAGLPPQKLGPRDKDKVVSISRDDDIDGEHEEALFGGFQAEGGP